MTGKGKYQALLDAIFCVVASDGKVSKSELNTVVEIFAKIRAPLSRDDIRQALEHFVARVKDTSLREVLDATKTAVAQHATSVNNRQAFFETLRLVADADGEVARQEKRVMDELRQAIESIEAPACDISDMLDDAEQAEQLARARQLDDAICPLCGEPTKRPVERICRICAGIHNAGVRSTISEVPVIDTGDGLLLGRFVLIRGDEMLWRGGKLRRELIEGVYWEMETDRKRLGVEQSIVLLISQRGRGVMSTKIASFFDYDEFARQEDEESLSYERGPLDEAEDAVIEHYQQTALEEAKEQVGSLCTKLGIWLVGGEPALRSRSDVLSRPGLSHGIRGEGLYHPLEDAVRDVTSKVTDFFSGKLRRKR